MFRTVSILVFGLALAGQAWSNDAIARAVNAPTAEEAVELATVELLALIEQGKSYAQEDPERFYVEVEALLRPLIDFPRFARNVMGAFYRDANDAQRQKFSESFKWTLVRTYALALTEFGGGAVTVVPPRRPPRDPNKVSVTQEIEHQGNIYAVVYLMQRGDDNVWQLRNLVIEGVNIGLNYKSQFAAAMKDPAYGRNIDSVIDAWSNFIQHEDEDQAADQTVSEAAEAAPVG